MHAFCNCSFDRGIKLPSAASPGAAASSSSIGQRPWSAWMGSLLGPATLLRAEGLAAALKPHSS